MQLALVVFAVLIGLCLSVPAFPEPEFDKPEEDTQLEARAFTIWNDEKAKVFQRLHNLEKAQGQLDSKVNDLEQRLNNGNETCQIKHTARVKGSQVGHLSWHHVSCSPNYYLRSFKLDHHNYWGNRYVYTCCKITY